jgi:hypothetical protein
MESLRENLQKYIVLCNKLIMDVIQGKVEKDSIGKYSDTL